MGFETFSSALFESGTYCRMQANIVLFIFAHIYLFEQFVFFFVRYQNQANFQHSLIWIYNKKKMFIFLFRLVMRSIFFCSLPFIVFRTYTKQPRKKVCTH